MAREDPPHIALLGPLEVSCAQGATITIGATQRRAVLAQLALQPGRAVSVDALTAGLWDDRPPPTSTKSIHVHISRLRQALPPDVIATRPPGYALDLAPEATDVGRFEAAVERARAQIAAGRLAPASDALRRALELWRGPALADLRAYPFADRAAVALDEARARALHDRIATDLELGRHGEVVAELEAIVAEHPHHEGCWGLLMVALYRCGRQAEALKAFARARAHLVDELGLEPGEELRRLEAQILAHDLPAPSHPLAPHTDAARRAVAPSPSPGPSMDPTVAFGLRPPSLLVGRDDVTQVLDDAAAAMHRGALSTVAIRGEEGLGKSAVIGSFVRSVGDRAQVAFGRCREHVAVPYGPWVQIARQLDAPTAHHLLDGGVEDESPERRRIRLFEMVTATLRVAAFDRPLVVVLDDLHWSDDATVELLMHALDELTDSPVTFVLAWRAREIVAGHPVHRLEHLLARSTATVVDLEPLGPDDLVQLIGHTAPHTAPDRRMHLARKVHDLTGGVPLFATEVLASLSAGDDVDVEPQAPETVRTLVAGRLSRADRATQQVAEACAILDEPLQAELLAPLVPDVAIADLLDALDQLVDLGLLDEDGGSYGFVHAAFRHSIVEAMRSGRRQRLHAEAYRVLGAAPVPPAVLVHHGESAGPLVGGIDVARHLRAAGDDAMHRGAFADAHGFYRRVLERATPDELAATSVAYADALGRSGDIGGMKEAATGALRAAAAHGADDRTVIEAVALLCNFGDGFGVDASAIAAVEEARELIEDPVARARATSHIAYHHAMWGSSAPVALASLAEAAAICPAPRPPDLEGSMLFAEGLARLGDADLQRRLAIADQLIALAEIDPSTSHHGRGMRLRCLALLSAGRFDELERSLDGLLDVAAAEGSWLYLSDTWRWRIAATIACGDVAAAEAAIAELEEIGRGPLAGRAFVGTQRMIVDWFTGRTDACLTYLDGMRAQLPEGDPVGTDRRLVDLIGLAALLEAGRDEEARAIYSQVRPHRDLDRSSSRRATAELALCAQAAAELGDLDVAEDLCARLEPFAGQLVVVSWGECSIGSADGYRASLRSSIEGRVDDDGFARAIDLERQLGDELSAARTTRRWERATARLASAASA